MSTSDDLKLKDEGETITDEVTVTWRLWFTDACTVFCRGVLAGLFPAIAGGTLLIAKTDSTDTETIALNGAIGFAVGLLVKGLERLHRWQDQNEMPNPFRTKGSK